MPLEPSPVADRRVRRWRACRRSIRSTGSDPSAARYGSELYRVIYCRSRNLFLLLHMFRKDTGRVPEAELRIARERWEDFKSRMGAERRRPPRAAGHDAP